MTVRVFVSSTWLDLQPERKAVEAAIHRMRETKFTGMEYFGSRNETTQAASLDEVDRSDVYVGIFGGRYGSGITEDEYRHARKRKLPCLIYFKDEKKIGPKWRDSDRQQIAKLAKLKKDLMVHVITVFRTANDLAARVTADLHRWLFDNYLAVRLERALRDQSREDARALLSEVKSIGDFPPELLAQLKAAKYVITLGDRSVTIGGNVSGSTIITGDGNKE